MDESQWVSAHAFYNGDLTGLLVDVVAPLKDDLAARALATDMFFLRYWDGGPHLRLRVLPSDPALRSAIETLIEARFAAYFIGSPSSDSGRDEEYARSAAILGRWEGAAYSERLYANNSVEFIPYRREHDRYGSGVAIIAAERHFTESSTIVLNLLTTGMSDDQRTAAACALLLLAWFTGIPDPGPLAHAIDDPVDGDLPGIETLNVGVVEQGAIAVLLARKMRLLAETACERDGTGSLIAWARSVSTLRNILRTQVATSKFTPPIRGWGGQGGIISTDHSTGVLRVLDICAHLACNRMGLGLIEEGVVRRVASHAITQLADAEA